MLYIQWVLTMYNVMCPPWHYPTEEFHCPKPPPSPGALSIHHSLLPSPSTLGNHWSFYCLHSFTVSRKSYNWNPTAWSFFTGFFHIALGIWGSSMSSRAHSLHCWIIFHCMDVPQFDITAFYFIKIVWLWSRQTVNWFQNLWVGHSCSVETIA